MVIGLNAYGDGGDDVLLGRDSAHGGDGSDLVSTIWEASSGGAGNDIVTNGYVNLGEAGHDVFFPLAYLVQDDAGGYYADSPSGDFEPGVDGLAMPKEFHVVDTFTGHVDEVVSTAGGTSWDFDGDGTADLMSPELRNLTQDDFFVTRIFSSALPDGFTDFVSGAQANDFFYGGGGNDALSGGGGRDFIFGGLGDDALSANSGDDLLVGNGGADRLYGGSGADELDGGDGNDILSGSTGDDFAYAGAGDDLVAGGDGADRLLGEDGQDRLNGGSGNDTLIGGLGRDVLIGGGGRDVLSGGEDADLFIFVAGDSRPGGGVRDVITDFQAGMDKLDLSALQISDFASQVSFREVGSGVIVYVDIDHGGFDYADFAVQLEGIPQPAVGQSDFIL